MPLGACTVCQRKGPTGAIPMFPRAGVDGGRAKHPTIDARITPSRVMMMVWQRENQSLAY